MSRLKYVLGMMMLEMAFSVFSVAQENTVGLIFNSGESFDAYTLFSPAGNKLVYLIDNDGRIVHQWESEYPPGNAVYLMEDGTLYRAGRTNDDRIRAGGAGGVIEKFDWDGNVIWTYENSTAESRLHHDFQVLPNGNVLVLVWESIKKEDLIANGRDPEISPDTGLWPEMVLEIQPIGTEGGNIIWEWHAWDHLVQDFDATKENFGVVSDEIGKINLNYVKEGKEGSDWHHANSINYNADLDQIMISVLNFDEIWIIDHNTTTEEAREEKGDLIFRWGNPITYSVGTVDDQQLFGQHNAQWIGAGLPDEGKIMIFNNGKNRPSGDYTSIVKIDPMQNSEGIYEKDEWGSFLPSTFDYEYTADVPTDFYSWYISGVQQLPNGHLLINDGAHGTFYEIDENESMVWKYINPVVGNGPLNQGQIPVSPDNTPLNAVFRALKYGKGFKAFSEKDMNPGAFVEIVILDVPIAMEIAIYPNPSSDWIHIRNIDSNIRDMKIYNEFGQLMSHIPVENSLVDFHVSEFPKGLYYLVIDKKKTHKIVVN
ncbi:MAG: aryl-sulfate sulfotransferase [Reichenbachiella sp.]